MVNDEEFFDDTYDNNESIEQNDTSENLALKAEEKAQRTFLARKRIDELLEQKRLKELLDDENDW